MTTELKNAFQSRKALIDYVAELTPWLEHNRASDILGGAQPVEQRLQLIEPVGYCHFCTDQQCPMRTSSRWRNG